ncbi:hypothetical protein NBRC111894_4677 [Sporolactobacillus inulinus]|uniref:Uncharacterized protein n=1 Tax=Sporolactobacillus inulinus TaxID=2078 RepID=A0A4Y1ZJP5_9BACL|nr:hypothetical protein [Sporolactobacillus inulinus]GAY79123.1 hypothetical protein NBRC111894_4677 [Sporolactobacillus inulinus]
MTNRDFLSSLEGELHYLNKIGSADWRQKRVAIVLHTAKQINALTDCLDFGTTLEIVKKENPQLNEQCSRDVANYLYNAAEQERLDHRA